MAFCYVLGSPGVMTWLSLLCDLWFWEMTGLSLSYDGGLPGRLLCGLCFVTGGFGR